MAAAVLRMRMPPGSTSGVGNISSSSGFPGWLRTAVSPLGTACPLARALILARLLNGAPLGRAGLDSTECSGSGSSHGRPRPPRSARPAQPDAPRYSDRVLSSPELFRGQAGALGQRGELQ